jgi:hypothetical protein
MANYEKMTFAERVESLLDERSEHTTKTKLSEQTGIEYKRLSYILDGRYDPTLPEILSFSDVLHVSPLFLATGRREQAMFTCDETGLYNSTVDALRQAKTDRNFAAVKEVFDVLIHNTGMIYALYQYLFGTLEPGHVPVVLPDGTRQLLPVALASGISTPYTRHCPEQLARLDLVDELGKLRQDVQRQQERQKTAHSAPSGSPADQKPV